MHIWDRMSIELSFQLLNYRVELGQCCFCFPSKSDEKPLTRLKSLIKQHRIPANSIRPDRVCLIANLSLFLGSVFSFNWQTRHISFLMQNVDQIGPCAELELAKNHVREMKNKQMFISNTSQMLNGSMWVNLDLNQISFSLTLSFTHIFHSQCQSSDDLLFNGWWSNSDAFELTREHKKRLRRAIVESQRQDLCECDHVYELWKSESVVGWDI